MEEPAKAIPQHLGIIVDGNRRWARQHGLATAQGHWQGYQVLKKMAYYVRQRGVKYLTAFIFSTENWGRSQEEVENLMKLFVRAFKTDAKKMVQDGFRIIFLGRRDRLSSEILADMDEVEAMSQDNTDGTTIALCFNYGGQAEIIDAARHLAADVQAGRADLAEMTIDRFRNYLYHPELPDMDMLVRTSGEQRLSGFMLWRAAYSEICFKEKLWPDVTEADIDDVLNDYAQRQRRFGK